MADEFNQHAYLLESHACSAAEFTVYTRACTPLKGWQAQAPVSQWAFQSV